MRLHVDIDKIEKGFTNRRTDGRFGWLMFPPGQTPLTDTVGIKAVLRRTFIFPLLIVAYFTVYFALELTLIAAFFGVHYQHYIHHINWRLLTILYRIAFRHAERVSLAEYFTMIISFTMLFLAFLLAARWAWNRRANRLNREGVPSEAAPLVVSGVWPPPPTASASADTLPRI